MIDQAFDPTESAETVYNKYHKSIPSDLKKLFFLKIIQHKNRTVLIPKLNHLAGDGYSYFYFLSAIAALSRAVSIPFKKSVIRSLYKPHHNRTVLKEFHFNETDLQPLQNNEKLTMEIEEIPKAEIYKMIKETAANFNQKVSTNNILSAMVVKKLAAVQKDYFQDDLQLTIPIDVRRQIKEYGAKFFGNGIMFKVVNFKTKDIEKLSIPELAMKIRGSMPDVNKEIFIDFLNRSEYLLIKNEKRKSLSREFINRKGTRNFAREHTFYMFCA